MLPILAESWRSPVAATGLQKFAIKLKQQAVFGGPLLFANFVIAFGQGSMGASVIRLAFQRFEELLFARLLLADLH